MSEPLPTLLTITAPELVELEDKTGPRTNEHGEAIPPGSLLTDLVQGGLGAEGWTVAYRWTTYTANAFDAQRGDNRYDVEVTLVDHESGRYTVSAKPRVGLLRRVFSGRPDPNEHALLRLQIDKILSHDGRVTVLAPWAVVED